MKMSKELTFILNGKHGLYLPMMVMVLMGAAFTIAGFGYNWGYKLGSVGVMSLVAPVVMFFRSTKVIVSQNAITTKLRSLGLPIDNSVYERLDLDHFVKTGEGIQFVNNENKLIRTIEGFEDQQQLDQIFAFLEKWLAIDSPPEIDLGDFQNV